jgi:hypothetical protein
VLHRLAGRPPPKQFTHSPNGSDYFSHATRGHDDSGFTFCATHGTDDLSFDLRAPCDPDDSSHSLLDGARLATRCRTEASHATGWCGPCLSHGSSTPDADLRGCRLPAIQALHHRHCLSYPKVSLGHPHRSSLAGGYGGRVHRCRRTNVVTGKWIFKHKFKADGTLERYKTRWVLRGFMHHPEVDCEACDSLHHPVPCSLMGLVGPPTQCQECIPPW